jgi:putative flippase GtrA
VTAALPQLLRFLIVGGGFSLGYSVLVALLIGRAGAPPFATTVILYLCLIPAAFHMQRRFAFRQDRTRRGAFAIYAATQIASLALVAAVTTQVVTRVVWIDTALLLLTTGLAAGLSFAIARLVTFAPKGHRAE